MRARYLCGLVLAVGFPFAVQAQMLPGLRARNGEVQLAGSISEAPPAQVFSFAGDQNAQVVSGDWNGDGVKTIGVGTDDGKFLLRNENTNESPDIVSEIPGNSKGIPVAGRWKGGDVCGIGLFVPEEGKWILSMSPTNPQADLIVYFGQSGDIPVVGDWDGDGVDTIGVVRPNAEGDILIWILCDSNESPAEDRKFTFGSSAHLPIAGDWDANGTDTPGLLNKVGGAWVLSNTIDRPDEQVVVMRMTPELDGGQPFVWGTK